MKNHVINVLGRQIKVIEEEIDNRILGLSYNDEGVIEISKSPIREKAHETLIHELVHAVFFQSWTRSDWNQSRHSRRSVIKWQGSLRELQV